MHQESREERRRRRREQKRQTDLPSHKKQICTISEKLFKKKNNRTETGTHLQDFPQPCSKLSLSALYTEERIILEITVVGDVQLKVLNLAHPPRGLATPHFHPEQGKNVLGFCEYRTWCAHMSFHACSCVCVCVCRFVCVCVCRFVCACA